MLGKRALDRVTQRRGLGPGIGPVAPAGAGHARRRQLLGQRPGRAEPPPPGAGAGAGGRSADHFHVLREGGRGVGRAERAAQRAQLALVKAEAEMAHRRRQGLALTGLSNRVRALRVKADKALAVWVERDAAWQ